MKNWGWWRPALGFVAGASLIGGMASITSGPALAQGGPPPLGGPLQGLSPDQMQRFNLGRDEFLENETPATGLGPVFNGVSCVQCHNAGAPGGASPANVGVSVVTRIGARVNGLYTDLEEFGGPLIQARSLREFIPNHPVPREVIPPQAQFISRRITTPLFGMGLIEAIPEATILARAGVIQPGGTLGIANFVVDPDTRQVKLGRFGWKAQSPTAHAFAGDAYLNEMGITNPSFPNEIRPQGQSIPPGGDPTADPEDPGAAVEALTDFMTFLAPPAPLQPTTNSIQGRGVFDRIRCSSCHVPTMTTGPNAIPALNQRPVNLYSDLLLHKMGQQLADGIEQGEASGEHWRTAPLWGLRFRRVLMHDGRATTIDDAIRAHGGEAGKIRDAYLQLGRQERAQLLEFLSRL